MDAFEGFEAVFGAAEGQLERPSTLDLVLLPFLLYLRVEDRDRLLIHVTDFHDNTWFADMSTEYLEDLRDEIGIGGSWEDFISYVRAVFASNNVKIALRGSSSEGATSASVWGQKARGTPKIRVNLSKLEGASASDAMGTLSAEMFKVYRSQADSLSSELARGQQLSTAYAQEKARADILQERLDALNFNQKKKRLRPTISIDHMSRTQAPQSIVASQFATPSVFKDFDIQGAEAAASSGQMEPPKATKTATKSRLAGPRLRAAPLGRKPKRKATGDSD